MEFKRALSCKEWSVSPKAALVGGRAMMITVRLFCWPPRASYQSQ